MAARLKVTFDMDALVTAMHAERARRDIVWAQVAREAGLGRSTLSRVMSHERRLVGVTPDVHTLMALLRWLGISDVARFIRVQDSTVDGG